MKFKDKLGKLRAKYENYIASKHLFGFTNLYMNVTQKLTEKERKKNDS